MGELRRDPVPSDSPGRRFDRLYQDNFGAVYSFVYRRASQRDDVPDLVSEVFATAWRRLAQVPAPPDDRWWLFATARRVLATSQRTRARRARLIGRLQREPSAAQIDPDTALEERVAALFARLRPKEREVVQLVLWDELTHAQVAAVLGCSVNAAAVRYHRALRKLRRHIAGAGLPDPAAERGPGDSDDRGSGHSGGGRCGPANSRGGGA